MAARQKAGRLDIETIPEIAEWIHMVEDGGIVACEDQHKLCAMIRRIFASEDLYLDRKRLDTYLGYQRLFPFDLEPDEKFMLTLILCLYTPDGLPRFKTLLLYVGRGYGKNGFITFLAFCLTSKGNGIPEYDVHVVATTEPQAKTSFVELYNIMERSSKRFAQGYKWGKEEITNKATGSTFKFLTANAKTKDGGRPGAVIFDEEHAYEDNSIIGVLVGGLGKKPDARVFKITTDGDVREGPLDEDKELAEAVLNGDEPDNRFLPMLFRLDDPDEIHDEAMWPKANPMVTRRPELLQQYRDDYREWQRHPAKHPEVPTKRFNCPTARADLIVTSWSNLEAASREMGDLHGLPCVLGIDYAHTTDMLGACLLFHRDGEWQALHHAWWCTRSADAGEVKAPLQDWADMGLLTIVDDVDISPELPCEWAAGVIDELGAELVMAALDDYRLSLLKKALLEVLGLDSTLRGEDQQVYVVRPSDIMKVEPIIDSVFANRQVSWGDSPLMRWSTWNAKRVPAPNNNYKYGKIAPHSRKTDTFMAFVHAMCVGARIPEEAELVLPPPITF